VDRAHVTPPGSEVSLRQISDRPAGQRCDRWHVRLTDERQHGRTHESSPPLPRHGESLVV
jgi:hypothetical protein